MPQLATCGAGVVLAWLANEPSGLLVAVAGASILGGRRVSLLSTAVFGFALAAFILVAGLGLIGEREANLHVGVVLAVALGISGLVYLDQTAGACGRDETGGRPIGELQEGEHRLQQLIDAVPALIWSTTREGTPSYVNKRFTDVTGATLEDTIGPDGRPSLSVVHPDDRAAAARAIARSFEAGTPFVMRYRQLRRDGSYRWTETRAEPLRDDAGAIVRWYGVSVDIDDLVTAQDALRQSERRYRDLFQYMPIGLTQVDASKLIPLFKELRAQGVTELKDYIDEHPEFLARAVEALEVEEVNQHITKMFGAKNVEEMRGPITRYWQPSMATIRRSIEARYRGEEVFREETKVARMDGSVIDVLFTTARPGAVADKSLVGFIDITEHKKAEEALRERERQLQLLVDAIPAFIWCLTPEGAPSYFNKRVMDEIGLTVADLTAPDGSLRLESVHPDDRSAVRAALMQSLETGEEFGLRYRQRRGRADYRWTQGNAEPLRDANGKIVQWYGVYRDIDDEMRAQQALRDRERELSQLVDMVPSLLWRLSPDGEPIFFNKRMIDFLGLDVADADRAGTSRLAAMVEAVVHPEDAARVREAMNTSIRTGRPFSMTYRLRRADGVYRWMSGRAEPMREQNGSILQWYGLCHDIDDQMQAEAALQRSERELQQLVDALPVHIWSWTPEGKLAYVNKRSLEELGISGANFEDFTRVAQERVHPEDAPEVLRTSANCLKTGEPFIMRYRRRWQGGNYRWIEGRCEPLRDPDGTIAHWYQVSIDIDDQVRAEEALRNSKRQLEQMIDAVPVNILSFAPSGKITYASKRYLDKVGSPPSHVEDFDALARDVAHPEDFPVMFRRASDGFATGQPFVNRFRRREKDGVYRWIEARAQPLRDAHGTIVQWYIASIDIEDEMRAQEALRERERTLRQLVETLPAMIDCAAPDGEPIYRSQQLREFLGYELEDLDGSGKSRLNGTLDAGVHPDDVAGVKEQYAYSLSTGEPYARRHRLRRFDGEYRWVETRAAPMRNADGAIVQWNVICLDIDGEVRAQEELRLAQEKMARASQAASLAELSASIAHEVNQPLAAIVATSHACRRWLSADPPNLERAKITLERIIRDANSASDVVSRIRALFSQMGNDRAPAEITEVVTEVRQLMADEIAKRKIRLETDFDPRLPPALIDRVQIQQVLINLIRNAIEASDTIVDGVRLVRLLAVRDGDDAIRVEVRDFGVGMKDAGRAFEPFFTTKKDGMGMGLAICRSIIESHDGRLWASDNEPSGTTLAFILPIRARDTA